MPSYQTFALDEEGNFDLRFAKEGQEAIKQLIKCRLLNVKGTDIFNIEGIDTAFFVANTIAILRLVNDMKNIILNTPGVAEASIDETQIIVNKGVLIVPFQFRTIEDFNTQRDFFVANLS